jgi:(E)-4-hydroxy-3-methylbut-2-enyl-diphosphate synthase
VLAFVLDYFCIMLNQYCISPLSYHRLPTREVNIGGLLLGNNNPIRIQTMTTTDTMDTLATVQQTIRCIEAGAELVRITAPSKNEAENLLNIRKELRSRGYDTPLIADIHFTPNAAEIAARIVEKVRINPGNYIDKKKFDFIEYTDIEYAAEIDNIRKRFTPLVRICKQHGTAMRIGTNHGSLSDRIMSRYGDSPMGMVESAMEFLRIARDEQYHQIVLSMKSSNPLVMVQAYRLLVQKMMEEFQECYPLHLGVTEAGDGEDGRIKSAIGICTLLEDGIGDTIRVSLTEDPEFEIPVCRDIAKRYNNRLAMEGNPFERISLPYDPYQYSRRASHQVANIGAGRVPIVIADFSNKGYISTSDLNGIGYNYHAVSDKWNLADAAADYVYTGDKLISFGLPGTLRQILDFDTWVTLDAKANYCPLINLDDVAAVTRLADTTVFVQVNTAQSAATDLAKLVMLANAVIIIHDAQDAGFMALRQLAIAIEQLGTQHPIVLSVASGQSTVDEQLIQFSTLAGGLLLDGIGDGIMLSNASANMQNTKVSGRTYLPVNSNEQFLNNTAFSILQATRTRISKTEYISCPSCGRTLFDLQETTAKIRNATQHLKGVKIAIMGCIVNGPGEMADADFGYVGSGPGKITLYKGKDIMKRNVPSDVAVAELIDLLKEHGAWTEQADIMA